MGGNGCGDGGEFLNFDPVKAGFCVIIKYMEEGQKTKRRKTEENRIWIGNYGIVNIEVGNLSSKEIVLELLKKTKEILKEFPDKNKILIDLGFFPFAPSIHTSSFRKQVAEGLKDIIKEASSKRVAVFGGDIVKRTITSFVIIASGIKSIKVLGTKEEALKWLKSDS